MLLLELLRLLLLLLPPFPLLTICLLIGKPMYKLVNPEFTVSLHQL